MKLSNATLVVRTRPFPVHKIEAAKSKLKCTSIIVFFTSCDTPKTLTCMNSHTRKYTQSHTHTSAHTQTYAWKVPTTSRANSYNALRPSEPTRVNASLTEELNELTLSKTSMLTLSHDQASLPNECIQVVYMSTIVEASAKAIRFTLK